MQAQSSMRAVGIRKRLHVELALDGNHMGVHRLGADSHTANIGRCLYQQSDRFFAPINLGPYRFRAIGTQILEFIALGQDQQ